MKGCDGLKVGGLRDGCWEQNLLPLIHSQSYSRGCMSGARADPMRVAPLRNSLPFSHCRRLSELGGCTKVGMNSPTVSVRLLLGRASGLCPARMKWMFCLPLHDGRQMISASSTSSCSCFASTLMTPYQRIGNGHPTPNTNMHSPVAQQSLPCPQQPSPSPATPSQFPSSSSFPDPWHYPPCLPSPQHFPAPPLHPH
jgi:hypothetical protein